MNIRTLKKRRLVHLQVIPQDEVLERDGFPKDTVDFAGELVDVLRRVGVCFPAARREEAEKCQKKKIIFHCFKNFEMMNKKDV